MNTVNNLYQQTALAIQLIIETGLRTSELPKVTVESVRRGYVESTYIRNTRQVELPANICERLQRFAKECGITSGPIFLTARGLPCGRNAMFHAFGKLAAAVGIDPKRLTSEALRKYYNDKQMVENNVSAVQASLGYRTVNYYVEYERHNDETLTKNLDDMLDF